MRPGLLGSTESGDHFTKGLAANGASVPISWRIGDRVEFVQSNARQRIAVGRFAMFRVMERPKSVFRDETQNLGCV